MNKHLYRIVFNKARGLLMVVAENVSSGAKAAGSVGSGTVAPVCAVRLTPLRFAMMMGLGLITLVAASAQAAVIADPTAPAGQQPGIGATGSGVTQVNITAPSAGGVSRNTYQQFDVDSRGVILNNSATNSRTQLGGWVEGNAALSGGSARVILNEVNSSNPSRLNGYVEVAGSRAQVVIANPSGISCDGCGFINANRATLTTGKAQFENGELQGYQVDGGKISINGAGLDGRGSDYTEVIARSVEVNAGIWANDLSIKAGKSGAADTGTVAIDVAKLGGMYAGKIVLVGSGDGVGVRNAGQIGASAGEVVITADGRLENSGQISSAGAMQVDAGAGVSNTGSFYAQGDLTLESAADVDNHGIVSGQRNVRVNGKNLRSHSGSTLAAGVDSSGVLGSSGTLTLQASGQVSAKGQNIAADGVVTEAGSIDLSDSQTKATQVKLTSHQGDVDVSRATVVARDTLTVEAQGVLRTDGAKVSAAQARLKAQTFSNVKGEVLQHGAAPTSIEVQGALDNSQGVIASQNALNITTGSLTNRDGSLGSVASDLTLTAVDGVLDNSNGHIEALQSIALTSAQLLNSTGFVSAGQNLTIKASSIRNDGGKFVAGKLLSAQGGTYAGSGRVLSLGDLQFKLNGDYLNSGLMQANGNLNIETTGVLNNQASLQAGNLLTLSAREIDNGAAGEINARQVQFNASQLLVNRGLIDGQKTRLSAPALNNLGTGRIYGDEIALAAGTLTNTAENDAAPVIAARQRLDFGGQYLNNSEHGLIFSAGEMSIGGALDADYKATGQARELNNSSGTVEALGGLLLNSAIVRNTNAHFSTRVVELSRQSFKQYQLSGSANRYGADQVSTYHDEVDHLVTPEGVNDEWNRYDITRVVTETQIASSDPAQLLAGGNLRIIANEVLNDNSRIIAGGLLQTTANSLINTEVAGQQVTTESGVLYRYYRIQRKGRDKQGIRSTGYNPAASVQAISLQPTVYAEKTAPQGSGTQVANLNLGAVAATELANGAANVTPISDVLASSTKNAAGVPERIVTGGLNTALPDNALFRPLPSSTSNYLIETDPRFTNYGKWLSSDYMLGRLNLDPAATQQRLGDGFYEQKLIREQVAQLTGRRFIDGYANDEAQYRGLIDSAVTYAADWKLIPGVALSAEQMAQLTSDIVWLVTKNVTLASGEVRSVLVPQVYVRVREGDINGAGGLMAGEQLDLNLSGGVLNSASLAGRQAVSIKSGTLNNLEGRIRGNSVAVDATQDVNILGGRIEAGKSLMVNAGRDLNVKSSVTTTQSDQGTQTNLSRVAGLFVTDPAATLVASAARDINVQGGQVVNAGTAGVTSLTAGRDVNLTTVIETYQQANHWNADNWRTESSQTERGSSLQAQGDLGLRAGNDLNARAASISSVAGTVIAQAARDVNLTAGQNQRNADEAHKVEGGNGFLSKKVTTTRDSFSETKANGAYLGAQQLSVDAGRNVQIQGSEVVAEKGLAQVRAGNDLAIIASVDSTQVHHEKHSNSRSLGGFKASKIDDKVNENRTTAVGSLISGDSLDVQAGRDGLISGSSLVSTADLSVSAGRDLRVDAAQNTFDRQDSHKEKTRDLTGMVTANRGGLDDITGDLHLSIGSKSHVGKAKETTLTGSTIGSSAGDVSLSAGRSLNVIASDLVSTRDMTLTGSDVTVAAGTETAQQSSTDTSRSVGVGRVIGGIIVDTYKSIRDDVQAAENAEDGRLKAVKYAQAALSTYNALGFGSTDSANRSAGRPANSSGSLIKIGTELASTRSKSTSDYSSETAKQATLNSGGTLSMIATGKEEGSRGDIDVIGSSLKAEQTMLVAKNNILLQSAQNKREWNNDSSDSKVAIGASFNIGSQNGFTLDLGAQLARSMGTGSDLTQVNSTLDTGLLVLRSGQDTTLKGAQVRAETLKADIGGNLNIASQQDESTQKNRQTSGGFGGSICVPPFCIGDPVTVSANIAASKMNSNFAAVTDQSGLFAGQGGYDIHVGGTTRLDGAVIASDATADKNRLDTDRLIVSDIKNKSEIKSQSVGLSASYTALENGGTETGVGGSIPLMLRESEQSRTRSAVSEGTIIVRNPLGASDLVGLNRDTANANEQLDRPDEKALQERMDLIQSSAKLGQSIVQTVVTAKQAEAEAQSESVRNNPDSTPEQQARAARAVEDANSWAIGGNKRLMADIATGLVAAGLGGAGGTTGVGILANTTAAHTYKAIGDYADQREFEATDSLVKKAWGEGGAARILLHTLAGATQGLSSGNALAGAQGAAASATFMPMVDKALKDSGVKESERNSLATLISAGVGAVAASGGNVGGQVTAANTGNAVDAYNRQLHPKEIPLLISEAPALALAAGISVEEAQARLGRALAYYTDAGWQSLLGSKGLPPDDLTLTHLGQALAPLGNMYDPGPTSDVPTLTPTIKNYTPEETLRLVQNYQFTHAAAFADEKINLNYLMPIARFDSDQTEALDFYNRNLNFAEGANIGQPYGPVSYTSPEGTFKGQREALLGTAEGIFTLGKNLLTHPVDTSEQIAFGLINTASHPVDLVGGLWAEGQTAYGLGKLYELQGDPVNSAAVIEKYKTEWALAFLPINRAEKAAKLGGLVKASEELGTTERVLDKVDGGSPSRLVVDEPNVKFAGGGQRLENIEFEPEPPVKLADETKITLGADTPIVRVNTSNSIKGSPEYALLNDPAARAANTRYELDNGNTFTTNGADQVAELTFTPVDTKVPRDVRQTEAGKQGRETDVGGHAQACSQGGTCDGYNLFPQDRNFNNSAYKVFYENEIKRALNDSTKEVGLTTIKFNRSMPGSPRPDTLSVTYTVDGKVRTRIFANEPNRIPEG
ncbi:hemagglutinin repeat-containing protein [Pseudomonas sp. EL_65y_Pfl1_R32]|uniref:two-partner secretion domain-containing protein n=1 Tax=Pseudomonas sp. EL_65y_Pfl1_R32 TaxID=3088696 RepID=UPI0030DA2462